MPSLFDSVQAGDLQLANRIVMAPLKMDLPKAGCRNYAGSCRPSGKTAKGRFCPDTAVEIS